MLWGVFIKFSNHFDEQFFQTRDSKLLYSQNMHIFHEFLYGLRYTRKSREMTNMHIL